MAPTNTPGVVAREDRIAALVFTVRAIAVLALLGIAMLACERLVLAEPERLGPEIEGFPTDRMVELVNTAGQVAFIGDSVVQTVADQDPDTRTLVTLVESVLGGVGVRRVSAAATSVDLHAAWLRYLAARATPPRLVLLGINPRSFSPHWERNPGWAFRDVAAMVDHPLFARLGSVLEWDWERPTERDFRTGPVVVGGRVAGTLGALDRPEAGWDADAEIGTQRYVVRYAADYARGRRIHELRALVADANACPFPVILYLTPIDVEAARQRMTAEQTLAMEQNLSLLRATLAASRSPTLDASALVAHLDFDHPENDPHEHLRFAGRIALAAALAAQVRALPVVAHP